jgi:hypothetical protein
VGTKMQTKGIENLINEIIAENFSNIRKEMDIQLKEAFRTLEHDQKNLPTSYYC